MSRQEESREFHRRDCLMLCRCEGGSLRLSGFIVDLSYGGAGIVGTEKLPANGTELLLTTRHNWEAVALQSRVAWVKSGKGSGLADFGVEFLGTLYERQEQLAGFFQVPDTLES